MYGLSRPILVVGPSPLVYPWKRITKHGLPCLNGISPGYTSLPNHGMFLQKSERRRASLYHRNQSRADCMYHWFDEDKGRPHAFPHNDQRLLDRSAIIENDAHRLNICRSALYRLLLSTHSHMLASSRIYLLLIAIAGHRHRPCL